VSDSSTIKNLSIAIANALLLQASVETVVRLGQNFNCQDQGNIRKRTFLKYFAQSKIDFDEFLRATLGLERKIDS
jgi:hypothetical protein